MKNWIIAVDGYSSCGKSTLAKALSKKLGLTYIDTGAMYRAVTLQFQRYNIRLDVESEVQKALSAIVLDFRVVDGQRHIFLNGEDVERQIRTMAVSNFVSEVAALSQVRRKLVEQQQAMGEKGGVILEGRDIGTVVFPNADLKVFLTASPEIRLARRYWELRNRGNDTPFSDVKANLQKRDRIDSSRSDSPLRQAPDAVLIDNTFLSINDQVNLIHNMLQER